MKLFTGNKKTTTGGSFSQTEQSNLDQTVLSGILKQALESNSGLAAVTQGQKAAGLYNSSTNKLLANDLLARLTSQTAQQGASKTVTRTGTPSVTKEGGSTELLNKAMLGLTAYQKMVKPAMNSKLGQKAIGAVGEAGSSVLDSITSSFAGSGDLPTAFNTAGAANWEEAIAIPDSAAMQTFSDSLSGVSDVMAPMFAESPDAFADPMIQSMSSQDVGTATDAAAAAEDTTNFPTASGTSSASSSSGNPSASEVLSEANATTVAGSLGGSALSSSSSGLGTATSGISYGTSTPSSVGSLSTGGYDLGSGLNSAGGSSDVLAGSAGTGEAAGSWGGNILGYVGPIMDAFNAPNNPKGEQDKDYRHAVGGAVLNYFGYGWAAPIVHEVAEPALNAAMDAGTQSMGTFGAVLADPVGAPISGQYDVGELITSTLDPANIFGGNEGGSSGALVGASVDPVGAALGDQGLFSVVKDAVDGPAAALGKVICTELAMQDKLPVELYKKAISPENTMKGRVLTGYHVWGIAAVRMLRKNKKLAAWLAPYVAKYIEHKAGKKNWQGFWIKTIMHPICWMLSFFNTDKTAYRTLYRRERNV